MNVRIVRTVVRLSALMAGGAGIVAWMVVWPSMEEPKKADAVVLLSGDGARLPGALRLMERGLAPTLVFVGKPDVAAVFALCKAPQAFEVVCLWPRPDNTRTEARAASELAHARRWQSMVLVTSRYHVTRARLLFSRCFDGTVEAIGDPPDYGPRFARRQIRHEWLGLVHASVVARRC